MQPPRTTDELWKALGRQSGLPVEAATEVVLVGEDLVLHRQEGAAGIDEIDHAELVLERDVLRADVFLGRDREERAALHGRVVRDEHVGHAVHGPDARDDATAGRFVVVLAVTAQGRQLEEGCAFVDHAVDAVAGHDLPAGAVPFDRTRAAPTAFDRGSLAVAQGLDQRFVGAAIDFELL